MFSWIGSSGEERKPRRPKYPFVYSEEPPPTLVERIVDPFEDLVIYMTGGPATHGMRALVRVLVVAVIAGVIFGALTARVLGL